MRTLCLVLVVCALAVHAQKAVDPMPEPEPTTVQASSQTGNTANNKANGGNNTNSTVTKNNTVNNPAQSANIINKPVSNGNIVNNAAQNINMINNAAQNRNMINNAAQNRNMFNNFAQNTNMFHNIAQNRNLINNIAQSRNMINNPVQNGNRINTLPLNRINMMNSVSQRFRNVMNTRAGGMVAGNYGGQMQQMGQNMIHAPNTGHKSTRNDLPPQLLPLFLRSDRGTKIALMNIIANNPALASFLPFALNGGLSDSMMRMLVVLGMNLGQSQAQGQGANPLMAMAAMSGADIMNNIAPLLLASQAGSNSAQGTGNVGAANPEGAAQAEGNPLLDFMVMNHML